MIQNSALKFAAMISLTAMVIIVLAESVSAAGKHTGGHGHKVQMQHGMAGLAKEVSRTVTVVMGDNFFKPAKLRVKAGETIKFVIKNSGEFVHEFNIGTARSHHAHQKEMAKMMERGVLEVDRINQAKMRNHHDKMMRHDHPNALLLEPGKSGTVIWKFSKIHGLEFACNVPGHYDAGMVGEFSIHK